MNQQKINILVRNKNIELVQLYFLYRNITNLGFHSYKVFKNMIIYITGINDKLLVRNIFDILLHKNSFKIRFIGKSRFYNYNPKNLPIIKNNVNLVEFN